MDKNLRMAICLWLLDFVGIGCIFSASMFEGFTISTMEMGVVVVGLIAIFLAGIWQWYLYMGNRKK